MEECDANMFENTPTAIIFARTRLCSPPELLSNLETPVLSSGTAQSISLALDETPRPLAAPGSVLKSVSLSCVAVSGPTSNKYTVGAVKHCQQKNGDLLHTAVVQQGTT